MLKLCSPAWVFFIMALARIFYSIYVQTSIWIIMLRFVVLGAWTYALNWICSSGYTNVSWFLVLLPFALLFTLL
jgi:hypothetical protein